MEAIIIFVTMLALILIKVPVSFSLGIAAVIAVLMRGLSVAVVPLRMFVAVNSNTLLAVFLFILVGNLMNLGGISQRIFDFCRVWVRHIKGSLGHVNVLASVIFAGMSGSAVADAAGLGVIEIEAMKEDGFSSGFSAAITAASSTIGPIIPPSIPFVMYAVLAEESIGRLFLGGVIPGILMAAALMVMVYIVAVREKIPVEPKASMSERWKATWKAIPALLTPVILLSGILFGVTTPSEAGVIATVYAIILGMFIYRELKFKDLFNILLSTFKSTASILIIVTSASVITWLLTSSGVPKALSAWILGLTTNKYLILMVINVVLLVMGCFLEGNSIIMIMVPCLLPVVRALGIDLVHFGVFFVVNVMIGLITPPVGLCLYISTDIAECTFAETCKAIIPMVIALFIALMIITYIPQTVTFLPNLLMG